jgi:hypothetical protein
LASSAKRVSTAFSQEHEVGVKWKRSSAGAGQPAAHPGVLVGGIVVEDDVDHLARRTARSTAFRKRMNSWCRWHKST